MSTRIVMILVDIFVIREVYEFFLITYKNVGFKRNIWKSVRLIESILKICLITCLIKY